MSSTRRPPPMDVYHDQQPVYASFDYPPHIDTHPNALQPSPQALANANLILQPSPPWPSDSPLKRPSPASSPSLHIDAASFDNVQLAPPPLYFPSDSPLKKDYYRVYCAPPLPHTQKPSYQQYPNNIQPLQQENRYPYPISSEPYPLPSDGFQHVPHATATSKRKAHDSAHLDRDAKKVRLEEPIDDGPLPDPKDIPVPEDDGAKPQLSYAQLIGLAILKSPDRKLTLAQIYDWIKKSFSYYHTAETGWTNSIRHNLSLNKAFVKKERPKDDPGKGHYWQIEEGCERQFLRDKGQRVPIGSDPVPYAPSLPSDGGRPATAPAVGHFSLPPKTSLKRGTDSSKFPPSSKEISSDATVPASDEVTPPRPDNVSMPPPSKRMKLEEPEAEGSPVPLDFNSSPPVVAAARHTRTKSSPMRFHSRNPSNGRPKSANTFKDSGFFSSIESSVPRMSAVGPLQLTSEPDRFERPSAKRHGRAEDEIARLRSSSFDPSPTKGKLDAKRASRHVTIHLENSSPLRGDHCNGLKPLTPGLGLQPPTKPPPTVSPNTNLRLHRESVRELVGTPAHGLGSISKLDHFTATPAFVIHEDPHFDDEFSGRGTGSVARASKFDPFASYLADIDGFDAWLERGSPIKKSVLASAKRPSVHRSNTALGALEDITGRRDNMRLGSPIHMPPPKTPNTKTKISPVKNPVTPLPKLNENELWGDSSDDELGVAGGIDLLQGFKGIGAASGKENEQSHNSVSATKSATRPALARSTTNLV